MFMKNIKDEVLTWNPFIIKKKEIALAPSQKGTYLVFFLFQSVIHTGDLSLRCHVDLAEANKFSGMREVEFGQYSQTA